MPEVKIPPRCIHFEAGMDACKVVANGWGYRDTGPCHPLRRVKCHHGPAYRLYPPGYAPYQRESVAPVDGAGEMVRIGVEDESGCPGSLAWCRTFFAAVLDAAEGKGWSRESPADDSRRRRTQQRYLELCASLLGLSHEIEETTSRTEERRENPKTRHRCRATPCPRPRPPWPSKEISFRSSDPTAASTKKNRRRS